MGVADVGGEAAVNRIFFAGLIASVATSAIAQEAAKIDARAGALAVFRQTCLDLQAPDKQPHDFMKQELGFLVFNLPKPPKIWSWDVPPFKKKVTLAYALEPYRCVVTAPLGSSDRLLAMADEAFGETALPVGERQLRAYAHPLGRIEVLSLDGPNPYSPWGRSIGIQLIPATAPATGKD
jgi:hypothetical protein